MKRTKRRISALVALAVALVMVLGMCVSVLAENNNTTITIGAASGKIELKDANTGAATHSFNAYQIFKGDYYQASGKTSLLNIEWGSGVNGSDFLNALKADNRIKSYFSTAETAADVAEAIKEIDPQTHSSYLNIIADLAAANKKGGGTALNAGTNSIEDGYYLIVDTTDSASLANSAYNRPVLAMTRAITINPKTEVPTVEKKVDDKNDSTNTEDAIVWNDSADYDIGDSVPYQITVNIPADADYYQGPYIITLTDTFSKGLTYKNDFTASLKTSAGTPVAGFSKDQVIQTIKTGTLTGDYAGGSSLEWKTVDLRSYMDGTHSYILTINYHCELNQDAKFGYEGNPNKIGMKYSNKPDWIPKSGEEPPTGETPEDKVIVFTYIVDVNKVNVNNQPLAGAAFELYKQYNSAADIPTGKTNANVSEALRTIFGEYYNASEIWVKVDQKSGTANTLFEFQGIDDGTYVLVETVAPAGYNKIKPVKFTVTATHQETSDDPQLLTLTGADLSSLDTGKLAFAALKHTGTNNLNGVLETNVVNKQGVELPETGGEGVKWFYIIGGILAGAAAVVLIARKRAER